MNYSEPSPAQTLARLIHDLRQPLTNLAYCTFRLSEMSESDAVVAEQVRLIERQIESAERLLAAAEQELRAARAQAVERASLVVTNSAS